MFFKFICIYLKNTLFIIWEEIFHLYLVFVFRLMHMGEHEHAAQLYISVEMFKEAIDSLISAEDWSRARKIAKELDPVYENYVETKYKDRLLKKGDVEQLADVGKKYKYH